MTHKASIVVIVRPGGESAGREFAERLTHAIARRRQLLSEIRPIDGFDLDEVASFDAALFLPGEMPLERVWRTVIDAFDEAETPMLAVVDQQPDANHPLSISRALILIEPPDIAQTAARLDGLLHQRRVIRRLKAELVVAQRFQGGLRGEISRIHDELQLAALVQQEILPSTLPSLHGMNFAALWRPANYVSGDIYDVSRLDEDHIGVFVADAVGHGVPAALMTMVISRALPTKDVSGRSYRIVPPGEALSRLNEEMIRRQGETTRFATAVYAVIDCRARTARIAAAGHPAPFLIREGRAMEELPTEGGLLGVFDDETFDEISLDLHLDDRLLFYSDGFEVAFPVAGGSDRDMKLPTKRYLEEFERLAAIRDPEQMIIEIGSRLDAQPGSLHQTDDLTFICAHAGRLAAEADRDDATTQAPADVATE